MTVADLYDNTGEMTIVIWFPAPPVMIVLVSRNRRYIGVLAAAGVEFILQEPAFHIRIKHDNAAAGPQTDSFGQLKVAGKDITSTANTFLLEKIVNSLIRFPQLFNLAHPLAVFGIQNPNRWAGIGVSAKSQTPNSIR